MAQATIKDLSDQLTEMSDKFVASFQQTMKVEDDLTAFLRGRQRWYVGTQQDSAPGAESQTEVPPQQLAEAAAPKKKKCPKPKNVKSRVTSKVDMGKVAKIGGLVIGVGLIVVE